MVDLGLRAGSAIDKKIKAKKVLKQQDKSYVNTKQSANSAKQNNKISNIAKNMKGGPIAGNTKVDKVAKMDRKNYLTGGINPSN